MRIVLLVVCALALPAAAAAPERVISLNLCADELLLQLADPGQIAGLSWLARDPDLSWHHEQAAAFPQVRGLAEEIIGLRPDLVLAGEYSTPATVSLLQRLGIRVERLTLAGTLAEIRAQIVDVAALLDQEARGQALLTEMDTRLAAIRAAVPTRRPQAAVYQANGQTAVQGSLLHDVMTTAGLRNLAADWPRYAPLPLEVLAASDPDLLIVSRASNQPSLATELLQHPLLKRQFAGQRTVLVPAQAWTCGTFNTVAAVAALHNAALDWADRAVAEGE